MKLRSIIPTFCISLLVPILCMPFIAFSQDLKTNNTPSRTNKKDKKVGLLTKSLSALDNVQYHVSKQLLSLSESLDGLIGKELPLDSKRKSQARLRFSSLLDKEGHMSSKGDLSVKIAIPKTNNRLQLLMLGDSDSDLPYDEMREKEEKKTEPKGNYVSYAEVRHVQKKTKLYSLTAGAGVKLRIPLDYYMKVRGRVAVPIKNWLLRFTETVFWYESEGTGQKTQIDLERAAGEKKIFRSASEAKWLKETGIFSLNQNFLLFHKLSDNTSLTWQAGMHGSSEGGKTVTDGYSLSASFRKNFHKDYLYYEIQPGSHYYKDDNFHSRPYIKIMLEMFFGDARRQ